MSSSMTAGQVDSAYIHDGFAAGLLRTHNRALNYSSELRGTHVRGHAAHHLDVAAIHTLLPDYVRSYEIRQAAQSSRW